MHQRNRNCKYQNLQNTAQHLMEATFTFEKQKYFEAN